MWKTSLQKKPKKTTQISMSDQNVFEINFLIGECVPRPRTISVGQIQDDLHNFNRDG